VPFRDNHLVRRLICRFRRRVATRAVFVAVVGLSPTKFNCAITSVGVAGSARKRAVRGVHTGIQNGADAGAIKTVLLVCYALATTWLFPRRPKI